MTFNRGDRIEVLRSTGQWHPAEYVERLKPTQGRGELIYWHRIRWLHGRRLVEDVQEYRVRKPPPDAAA